MARAFNIASKRISAERVKRKLDTRFVGNETEYTAAGFGSGGVYIAGRIYNSNDVGVGTVKNVGRPAAAFYATAEGGSGSVTISGGGSSSSGGTGSTDYLLRSGTLPMLGNLDMGNRAITNVALVDGRDVSVDGAVLDGIQGSSLLALAVNDTLTNERALVLSNAFSVTDGGAGGNYGVALATPGTLSATSINNEAGAHSHAVDASDNPGAAASLLKSSAAGLLTLPQFTATTQVTTPTIDTASGDLSLSPATGITTGAQFTATTKVTTPLIDSTGDLTLSPDGFDVILDASVNLVSSNYVSETAGFRLPSSGAADILSVTTNEMTSRQSIYGAGTAFRVLHHTHDYDHAHVVVNPGGSWNLDEQFGVDIDDNLLVRGYIVGKHAIQLPGAMMICHFDGAEPYETNYTGNPMGHMGQVGTETGGVVYRPGKFGKAVQLAEATTNLVTNPSFEERGDAPYWGTWFGTGTVVMSYAVSLYGTHSLSVTATAADYAIYHDIGTLVADGESLTVSAYFLGIGSATIYIYDLTVLTGRASATETGSASEWTRLVATWTNTTGGSKFIRLGLEVDTAGATLLFDGVQAELKAYATPYCDGSLEIDSSPGGHSWNGTEFYSTSSRTASTLTYDASTTLSPLSMTIGCWVRRSGTAAGYIVAHPGMSIEFL